MNTNIIFTTLAAFAAVMSSVSASATSVSEGLVRPGRFRVYVDGSYDDSSVPSDGTAQHPWRTVRAGCEAVAAPNTVVLVRGAGRVYRMDDLRDTAVLAFGSVSLVGCDADWNPVVGRAASEMARVVIADDFAEKSYATKVDWDGPFVVTGDGCVISGFAFDFGAESFRRSGSGGRGLVNVRASGLTVANCRFSATDDDAVDGGAGTLGVVCGDARSATGCTIRDCHVVMSRGEGLLFYDLLDGARVEGCVLENVGSLFGGDLPERPEAVNYHVVSNSFLNCGRNRLLASAGGSSPSGGEVAYNRVIRDNLTSANWSFVRYGGEGGGWCGAETYVHHNTVVGYDTAFEGGSVAWRPKVFDNLFVNVGNCIGGGASAAFGDGSTFYNNALYRTGFAAPTALDVKGTVSVAAEPGFSETDDPFAVGYYRLKSAVDPWVLDAWTGLDPTAPEFPGYIGAVAPQSAGFAIRIR